MHSLRKKSQVADGYMKKNMDQNRVQQRRLEEIHCAKIVNRSAVVKRELLLLLLLLLIIKNCKLLGIILIIHLFGNLCVSLSKVI